MIANFAIENRLRVAGIVALVMAVPAIAEHVDHDVFLERLAIVVGHLRHANAGFRIVAIDVEDGRLHHASHIGGIGRRAGLVGIGGESDLVVDHQVDGAAGGVAFQLRKVQRLGHHTLSGESRVAVNHNGDHTLARRVAQAILLGPGQTFHYRIHRFQMARIEGHRNHDFAARRRFPHAAGAQVIFHVARTLRAVGIDAFELGEQLHHRFADDIRQHVQASAVRHADHRLMYVGFGGAVQDFVQNRDGRFPALQRKTLVTNKARVQKALELFGFNDALERAQLGLRIQRPAIAGGLHAQLQPALLLRNLDVHVLASDFSAVGLAQGLQDFAQRGHLLRLIVLRHQRAGQEFAIQIPNGQAVGGRVQLGMINRLRT